MSASAQNYAYVVKVSDKSREIPVISKERLEEAKKDAASLWMDRNVLSPMYGSSGCAVLYSL